MRILDIILSYSDYWLIPSFFLALYGGWQLFKNRFWIDGYSFKRTLIGMVLIMQLFISGIGLFRLHSYFITQVRKEYRSFLSQPNLQVKINGRELGLEESKKIINQLKSIGLNRSSRSEPTKKFNIYIKHHNEEITLTIRQDSETPNDYRIYYNGYKTTTHNSLGRIKTNVWGFAEKNS